MKRRRRVLGLGGMLLLLAAGKAAAAPQLVLQAPRAAKAPVIDGILSPGEWNDAVSWRTGGWHFVDIRKVRFFVLWDPETVYVAQQTELLPGERIVRTGREPKPDVASAMETAMEVYIDAATKGSDKMDCTYQVIANACGNFWDVERQVTIGQQNVGWNGAWIYRQQLSPDRRYWTAEMAIPRGVVFEPKPLADGRVWKMGFAREGGSRPNGLYGCAAPVTFKDACPVVRLDGVDGAAENRMAFTLRISNPTKRRFEGTLRAAVAGELKPSEERALRIEPGKETTVSVDRPAGLKPGERADFSIEVVRGDETVFRWSKPIVNDELLTKTQWLAAPEPRPFEASVVFNPARNFLRATIDRYEFPGKDHARACRFEVRTAGKTDVIARGTADDFRYDKAETVIGLPPSLPPGRYEAAATLLDADGKALGTMPVPFEKRDIARDFPWVGNSIGVSDRVLWPFHPMATEGSTVRPWNREIVLDGLALPASVVSAGRSLLSRPVSLSGSAGGADFTVAPGGPARRLSAGRTAAEFSGAGRGGPLAVSTKTRMEYDGCAKIEMTMEPADGKTAELDGLRLEIPFRAGEATHMHTVRDDMRISCYAGFVPPGEGRVWDSTRVPANRMTVGSFVPLVFLGTPSAGVTWFADSDEGWWPADGQPGAEIVRRGGETVLRLNLASGRVSFSGKRTVVFGLHVSPVRPVDAPTWTPGTGICGLYEYDGRFDRKTQRRGFYLYPADPKKFNTYYTERFGGRPMGVYIENATSDIPAEDAEYFADEWEGGRTRTLSDCGLHYAKKLLTDCPVIHGFYIDNIYPRATWNVEAGSAYRLPDGRIQPGFDIWESRDFVRRLRTLLQDMKTEPHGIEVHMTCTMVIPVYAWADMMREGENPVQADAGRKDFADLYPPAFSAVMNNQRLWGVRTVHHWMYYTQESLFASLGPGARWTAERTGIGHLALHDLLFPRPAGDEYLKLIRRYDAAYASAPGPEEFIPYWDGRGLVSSADRDVLVSVRRKPDRLAVWVVNYAREARTARIALDLPRLLSTTASSTKGAAAADIESMDPAALDRPTLDTSDAGGSPTAERRNTLTVTVPPRDFRVILVK